MRYPAPTTARYWRCGGELLALGGPLPLKAADGRPSSGCRPISAADLRRLADWHLAELTGGRAIAFHGPAVRDALAALAPG